MPYPIDRTTMSIKAELVVCIYNILLLYISSKYCVGSMYSYSKINVYILLLQCVIIGSSGQCIGKVLVTRTSSNCRGQFLFGCNGLGSTTITRSKTLCDEIGISEGIYSAGIVITILYNCLFAVGCRGDECDKTFDLIKGNCQNPGTGNTVSTLHEGMESANNIDCTCTSSAEDLIRAIRVQSALGALVGLLSFTLIVVILGWVRTYCLMTREREGLRRNLHEVR